MIEEIAKLLDKKDVHILLTANADSTENSVVVTVTPVSKTADDNAPGHPFQITGTPRECDIELPGQLRRYCEIMVEHGSNMEEIEAAIKAEEEEARKKRKKTPAKAATKKAAKKKKPVTPQVPAPPGSTPLGVPPEGRKVTVDEPPEEEKPEPDTGLNLDFA